MSKKIDISVLQKTAPSVMNPEAFWLAMMDTLRARDKFIESMSERQKEKLRKKGINV